jgi:hypothetical protein
VCVCVFDMQQAIRQVFTKTVLQPSVVIEM